MSEWRKTCGPFRTAIRPGTDRFKVNGRAKERGVSRIVDYIKTFERVTTTVLIVMMALVVALSVADLAWLLIKDILSPPLVLLDINELVDIFGMFLLVLIGIELLETFMAFAREREVHTEVIILVAMIALARKIITLDVNAVPSVSLLGIAAIVLALGVTYYIVRQTRSRARSPHALEGP